MTERTFSFGMDDQHLVFTKPVEIHIKTENLLDGTLVMLRVKHAGDG
ncbi:hypothetical protein KBC03_07330 [Patescibacteria group bacterium]|nr:hypothetical protein [Patescibacteria group bacterium]